VASETKQDADDLIAVPFLLSGIASTSLRPIGVSSADAKIGHESRILRLPVSARWNRGRHYSCRNYSRRELGCHRAPALTVQGKILLVGVARGRMFDLNALCAGTPRRADYARDLVSRCP